MTILVTGGAGYIGSHVVKMLLERGENVVIIDNLSRGHKESIPKSVTFEKADLLDFEGLSNSIKKFSIDAVIHFAAFAYVGESVDNPQMYYSNNVVGSFNLIDVLKENNIDKIVFSSTCSVYGNPLNIPISESETPKPINPYAKTKFIIENILNDYGTAYGLNFAALRYFNAAGDSDDSQIGESHDPETHLIPLVLFAALGRREKIYVYGDDYPTKDGTCIRDYIHVNDLADAHIKALEYLRNNGQSTVFNLGTGNGYSVNEIIDTARKISGVNITAEVVGRRPGDPAELVADNKKAREVLGWIPKYNLDKIIKTAWAWHKNPKF